MGAERATGTHVPRTAYLSISIILKQKTALVNQEMYVAPIGTAGQSIIERIFIMIYDEIADTLLRAGIPVNTKGFIYTML